MLARRWFLTLLLLLPLPLICGPAVQAAFAQTEASLYHDELAKYGQWVDYQHYGPVWYPTTVSAQWRPYLDGRWLPSGDGWIFETNEPWGWATYHYGNWLPTDEYGWVWVPGSTWYPSTAAWRTNEDYIGWAPVPPPDYTPTPAYYPTGGYSAGEPILDLITAPFWLFAAASTFLLGFEQPYAPAYSYYNCGCMAPFSFVPVLFPRTSLLHDFFFPAFAPSAFFLFGPQFPFVSKVTNINIVRINNFVKNVNITKINNVLPPKHAFAANPALQQVVPAPLREGKRLDVRKAGDVNKAALALNRPNAVPPPQGIRGREIRVPKDVREIRPAPRVPEAVRGRGPGPQVPEKVREPVPGRRGTEDVRRGPSAPRTPEIIRGTRRETETRGPERFRGTRLPPQSVPDSRDLQRQLQQQRQRDRLQVPGGDQRRMMQQERQIRRQDIFRQPSPASRPTIPQAPQIRRGPSAPTPQIAPMPRPAPTIRSTPGPRPAPAPAPRPAPAPGSGGSGRGSGGGGRR